MAGSTCSSSLMIDTGVDVVYLHASVCLKHYASHNNSL